MAFVVIGIVWNFNQQKRQISNLSLASHVNCHTILSDVITIRIVTFVPIDERLPIEEEFN